MNIETGVKNEKPTASVEWKVKGSKEKVALSERDKCEVYPRKSENKLSAWMCALVRRFKKYDPPTFSGLASESPQGFLDECHRILCTMGILKTSGVAFTTFQLRREAYQWWRAYELGSPAELTSLTWVQLSEMFLREFVPQSLRETWCAEFEQLRQGTMSVSEYAVRFSNLARHMPTLVATVRERVRKFIEGHKHDIRFSMAH
ncbi:uncharacterized protein [Nicotiana tomentosiformis]|uniref:uncharacterized protein n=1 Tax=Nicotiana tomentosiformis TaxID=4098 RepID=UPI00388C4484